MAYVITGCVVGGVMFLALTVVIMCTCCKKKKRKVKDSREDSVHFENDMNGIAECSVENHANINAFYYST